MNRQFPAMSGMIVASNIDTVRKWDATQHEHGLDAGRSPAPDDSPLLTVSRRFEKSIDVFERSVPFIMQTTPLMRSMLRDRRIRKFVVDRSELISDQDIDVYQMDIHH